MLAQIPARKIVIDKMSTSSRVSEEEKEKLFSEENVIL